jgi:PAS domain S-box-containing protein
LIEWSNSVVLGDRGEVELIIGTGIDVTEKRAATEALATSEARLRALLDSLPDAVWLKDAEGRYIEVNRSFRERSGVVSAGIAGRTDDEIFPAELVDAFRATDREVLASGLPVRTERKVLLQGKERWIDVTKVPITDGAGKITGLVGIGRDVSKRKLAEAQRLGHDAGLRAALVREVHHRIKNSLQGIITLLQRADDAGPAGSDPLELAISRINAMAAMHGLHGFTTEGDLELGKIVMTLISSLKTLDPALPLRLSMRGEPVCVWVKENEIVPLALILSELIMNAIKHSPSSGNDPIEVALEIGTDVARISIGNSSGRLPRLFDFEAGEGLGVGLSLVKSLLPPEGAVLRLANGAGGRVHGELTLRPPVIAPSPRAKSLLAGQNADPPAASSP